MKEPIEEQVEQEDATASQNTGEESAENVEAEIEIVDEDEDDEDEEDSELERLKDENQRLKTSTLRAHADLENFKKRASRERQEAIKYANKNVFIEILNVLDNFDRAMEAVPDPKDNFVIGVGMIQRQLLEVLTQNGVEIIDAVNKPFDPYLHEAIAREETDAFEEGTIMDVFQKGFTFNGSLLRPSKVKVSAPVTDKEEAPVAESDES